jgi:hypothetical protein
MMNACNVRIVAINSRDQKRFSGMKVVEFRFHGSHLLGTAPINCLSYCAARMELWRSGNCSLYPGD